MQYILLQGIKLDDFLHQIEKTIETKVNEKLEQFKPKPAWEYQTRKEVSKLLKVSYPTLDRLIKDGVITSYRIGKRILFRSDEIQSAAKKRNFNLNI
jgi:excisionase family DNA binding protein